MEQPEFTAVILDRTARVLHCVSAAACYCELFFHHCLWLSWK